MSAKPRRAKPRRGGRKPAPVKPAKTTKVPFERERGPRGWLVPILESAYARLTPREAPEPAPPPPPPAARVPLRAARGRAAFRSRLRPGMDERVLAPARQELWVDTLAEYKRRKALAATPAARRRRGPPRPGAFVPGEKNWLPLGPSVVLNGQARGLPPVGGRVAGIAVAAGGQIVYAASANGGVFRSDDGGTSWRSLMDAFDVDPTQFASTSLACGAIAIDQDDPQRVYVGTGEGDTYAIFNGRIINALPAYRGIGPIRSDDAGTTWITEESAAGSPSLAGKAFFALAVDPADRERVLGATSEGLYLRGGGPAAPKWTRVREGVHSSVVATRNGGATRFFAAEWGKGVLRSTSGSVWSDAGTGFPSANVGRIALGVQSKNPDLVYAFVATTTGALLGIYRLDGNGAWKRIASPPDVLPSDDGNGQGDYDLAIAVDPVDGDVVYVGGSYFADNEFWPASVWCCKVKATGASYSMTSTPIGAEAHAGVHVLVHTPDDRDALWVGCDGGVFLNRAPRAGGVFKSRNDGLACLCTNFFAQHPTDPGILFCGLQDNGTARASGGPIWTHVNWGDGGYCLINWADPKQVLVFANGTVYRATDGGQGHESWKAKAFPWALMTEPIVGTPYNPARPQDAKVVAVAAGTRIHLSSDFGSTWPKEVAVPTAGGVFALAFASADRFFAGTTAGEVFRGDRAGTGWQLNRIDDAAAGPLGLRGLVSDVAIDWSDPARGSVYVTFGGTGDYRHLWRFDGQRWEARSGPANGTTNLLDVEHNAVVADPVRPDDVYVGADIGVWYSPNGGRSWQPLPNGLPDAPIFELQIHPTRRLLRASTHGRGLHEFPLDA